MSDKMKKMEKESGVWKSRFENCNKALTDMIQEVRRMKGERSGEGGGSQKKGRGEQGKEEDKEGEQRGEREGGEQRGEDRGKWQMEEEKDTGELNVGG